MKGCYLRVENNCAILGAVLLGAVQIVVVSVPRNAVLNALAHCAVFLYVDVRKSVVLSVGLLSVADGHSSVLDGRKCALGVRYLVQFPLSALDGHKPLLGVLLPPQYDDHQKTLAHNVLQVSHRRH